MGIPYRLFSIALATALTGCGGDLTLPDDSAPAALRAWSGDGQQGTVGSRLDDPLVVKLTDASSRPMFGVPVVFQFTNDVPDAKVDAEATTDSLGLAAAEVRLGTSAGTLQVRARVATAAALNATFVLTALERDNENKGGKGGGHGDDDDDDD